MRTAIERAFSVLKKRFLIITSTTEPSYCVDTQNEIILACCILHNHYSHHERAALTSREDDEDARQEDIIRDSIALAMWQNYVQM